MQIALSLALIAGLAIGTGSVLWLLRRPPTAAVLDDGTQRIAVRVKGDYRPRVVKARLGTPLRIDFLREEDNDCSRTVVFPDFGIERTLPAFRTTTVELTPDREGEFLFTCKMGIYQGTLMVERGRSLRPLPKFQGGP